MPNIFRVTWRVMPIEPPSLWRNCKSCGDAAPFRCSGKFRTNAQKKRIDIWLIYNCATCGDTWNLPILERIPIADMAQSEFEAMAHNESEMSARYAFDTARLSRHGRIEECPDADIAWIASAAQPVEFGEIAISIGLARPWHGRLERILAGQLGIRRNQLWTLHERGQLTISPVNRNGLRGSIGDGQHIRLKMDAGDSALIASVRRACGVS